MTLLVEAEVVYAVPDLHGRLDLLEAAVRFAQGEGAHLVVLGDVIDRGPASLRCVRRLLELEAAGRVTLLWGNHEQMAHSALAWYEAYQDSGDLGEYQAALEHFQWWLGNGGDALWREEGPFGVDRLPPELVEYLSRLRPQVFVGARGVFAQRPDEPCVLAVHAAPPKAHPDYPDPETAALWLRPQDGPFALPPFVTWSVHGHTPLPQPLRIGSQVYTDLGAVRSGRLCLTRLDPNGPLDLRVLQDPRQGRRERSYGVVGEELPYRTVLLTTA